MPLFILYCPDLTLPSLKFIFSERREKTVVFARTFSSSSNINKPLKSVPEGILIVLLCNEPGKTGEYTS